MKRFLHFLIILFTFGCYFQAYGLGDSLKRELKNQTIDSVKVDILMSIARTYAINKPDSADIYINQLRDLSKSINQPEGLISAEMSSALKFAYTDNLSASNEKLFDAAKIAEKYKRIIRLNEIYLTLGINNLRMAKYDEAIEYLNKSLELAKKNNDLEKLGRTYVTLGIFYNKQGQYRKEQKYLFRALDVFKNGKSLSNLSSVYGNIGSNYMRLNEVDSAKYFLRKSLEIDLKTNDLQGAAIDYHNIGALFNGLKQNDSTIYYLRKSIELKEQLGNTIGVANTKYGLAETYYQMKKIESAKELLIECTDIYRNANARRKLLMTYEFLDSIYAYQNNYIKAYEYSKLSGQLKDSIFNEKSQKIISDFESKYKLAEKEIELTEKEFENEKLKRKSEKQEFTIIIILLVIMLIAVISIILYIRHRSLERINKILQEKNDKIEKQNEELETLNSELVNKNYELEELNATKDKFFSIISHDLKGPISSSYQLIDTIRNHYGLFSDKEKKENFDLLYDSTYNTYLLLENLLTWSRAQRNKIEYKPELINIKSLTDNTISHLLVFSEQKNITINNNISDDLNWKLDVNMVSTVLRNLINNSIKFTDEKGEINVDAIVENDTLKFSVSDNGIGMNEDIRNGLFRIDNTNSRLGTKNEKGTGLGLIIAWEFIKIHDGNIWVESKIGEGSVFYFTIPKS